MGSVETSFPFHGDQPDFTKQYAESLDAKDPLRGFRDQFVIPSKKDLTRKTIVAADGGGASSPSIYFCGNSLGLQPKNTRKYVDRFLQTWATKAVLGHFTSHEDELSPRYMDIDDAAANLMAPVVGALPSEVAVMDTLTTNLHLLMTSFYRPTKDKHKIILEGKAFPSDHFAVQSQIQFHGFDPKDSMILIQPDDEEFPILSTEKILKTIDEHASSTALVLLPGIQYYTGQYFDIPRITAHAHAKGLLIGWDCAHAAGNVDIQLHDWDVDFAAWCTYKYLNAGPGAMGGLFVHEKHGKVNMEDQEAPYRQRLAGWWGGDKGTRFIMDNKYVPRPGAAGFQISNPSIIDMNAVLASLEVFSNATMPAIRKKSLELTAYLERLLLSYPADGDKSRPFSIITPSDPAQRGAQLSVRPAPGLMEEIYARLLRNGIILDERKPDVIRVSPCPLYNSFSDVWEFIQVFFKICQDVVGEKNVPV